MSNLDIVDQRVQLIYDQYSSQIAELLNLELPRDKIKIRSICFVFVVAQTLLDLSDEDALECLTDGFSDFRIDALHTSLAVDGKFTVTIFQAKYVHDLSKQLTNFKETDIACVIPAVKHIRNPASVIPVNDRLAPKIQDIQTQTAAGEIPLVRVVICNNGLSWKEDAQAIINMESYDDQVTFEHVNHDSICELMQANEPINARLATKGKWIEESHGDKKVFIGKAPVREIETLFNQHGDRLLNVNIRKFLGFQRNSVNSAIKETLLDDSQRACFYLFNNGVTISCNSLEFPRGMPQDVVLTIKGIQVLNGGQTCRTIQSTLSELAASGRSLEDAYVLVRIYVLPEDSEDLVAKITLATNSQNPVDLRDLRSNEQLQKNLEYSLVQLAYSYQRFRSTASARSANAISSAKAAESVLAVWRQHPFQAKFHGKKHFGDLYSSIFTESLNGSQVILAHKILKFAEKKRRTPPAGTPVFIAYGSYYVAMLMGKYLLEANSLNLNQLNHSTFAAVDTDWEKNDQKFFDKAIKKIGEALTAQYGDRVLTPRELAEAFRGSALKGRVLS
jgi:hypothetical protein